MGGPAIGAVAALTIDGGATVRADGSKRADCALRRAGSGASPSGGQRGRFRDRIGAGVGERVSDLLGDRRNNGAPAVERVGEAVGEGREDPAVSIVGLVEVGAPEG